MKIRNVLVPIILSSSLLLGQFPSGGAPRGRGMLGMGAAGLHGMHMGKIVTGAPYSATVTSAGVRTLSDGNTIQRNNTGMVARDSQGRTYSQQTITGIFGGKGSKLITFISDPVAGYVYTLDPASKTAYKRALPSSHDSNAHAQVGNSAASADLGAQTINGVYAQGKTATHTIPAGEMGNEKPIVSTTETWYSPDLQVVIMSKRTDPIQGNTSYALTNISRAEPNAALFAVPSDYTIKDASEGFRHQ